MEIHSSILVWRIPMDRGAWWATVHRVAKTTELLSTIYKNKTIISSVQLLNCVWLFATHGLQHTRLPCPSLSPGVYSSSCPLSKWCHPIISSSVIPFSSCPQSFPAWGSFPMNWLLTSGGQSIGASPSASVLPMNIQGWSPLGLTGLISLLSKGLKSLLQHQSSKASVLWSSAFFMAQLSQLYMTTGKTIALAIQSFVYKVMSLLFNMLSRFVITFLSMNKCLFLLISWLQSPSAVILEPNNIKSVTVSTFPLSIKWWNQMPSWS